MNTSDTFTQLTSDLRQYSCYPTQSPRGTVTFADVFRLSQAVEHILNSIQGDITGDIITRIYNIFFNAFSLNERDCVLFVKVIFGQVYTVELERDRTFLPNIMVDGEYISHTRKEPYSSEAVDIYNEIVLLMKGGPITLHRINQNTQENTEITKRVFSLGREVSSHRGNIEWISEQMDIHSNQSTHMEIGLTETNARLRCIEVSFAGISQQLAIYVDIQTTQDAYIEDKFTKMLALIHDKEVVIDRLTQEVYSISSQITEIHKINTELKKHILTLMQQHQSNVIEKMQTDQVLQSLIDRVDTIEIDTEYKETWNTYRMFPSIVTFGVVFSVVLNVVINYIVNNHL